VPSCLRTAPDSKSLWPDSSVASTPALRPVVSAREVHNLLVSPNPKPLIPAASTDARVSSVAAWNSASVPSPDIVAPYVTPPLSVVTCKVLASDPSAEENAV